MTHFNKKILKPIEFPGLIRIGKHNDGGYVVPRSMLDGIDVLLSFGIGNEWSFEEEFRKLNPKAKIEAYDPTVSPAIYRSFLRHSLVKMLFGFASLRPNLARWHRNKYLEFKEFYRRYRDFFCSENNIRHFQQWVAPGAEQISDFQKWIAPGVQQSSIAPRDIFNRLIAENENLSVFLKIDIEGAEYSVIEQIVSFSQYIKCIVIECHDIDRRLGFVRLMEALLKDFSIVHIHGNNNLPMNELENFPVIIELTLVNKAQFTSGADSQCLATKTYPIPGLDEPSDPEKADCPLNFD